MAGDFWTANADVPPPRSVERLLICKSLRGVEPLEPRVVAGSERRLPEPLTEVLFGQAGSPRRPAASNTYAILDAAKITGLPDMLEVADMASRCLFRGHAYHKLADRLVDEGVRTELRNDGHLRRFVEVCRHADGNKPDWRCRPDVVRTFEAGHAPARLLTELEYDLGAFEQELHDE